MPPTEQLAKFIIGTGLALVIIGVVLYFLPHLPFSGKLPGDIFLKKGKVTVYFPVITSIIVSIVLTVILNVICGKR